jgi:hypothetical protein
MVLRVLALFVLLSAPGWCGVTLTLGPPTVQTGLPGTEVFFQGNFSVAAGDPDIFLTDLEFDFNPPGEVYLTPDTNPFFINAPGDVCDNDPSCITQYSGDLFGIQIDGATPLGNYFGSVIILGGADPGDDDPLTTIVPFEVDVASPEPATLPVIGTVLLASFAALRRKISS